MNRFPSFRKKAGGRGVIAVVTSPWFVLAGIAITAAVLVSLLAPRAHTGRGGRTGLPAGAPMGGFLLRRVRAVRRR